MKNYHVSHLGYSRFHTNCKHVHSCPDSCHINQFHTSTHVLKPWTKLRSSWHFCSELSSITPARQMVHEHQKPVSRAKQANCDKPQTFKTRARVLTMCLSPNCLMPESQVYAKYSASCNVISHFCILCHSANQFDSWPEPVKLQGFLHAFSKHTPVQN